MDNALLDRTIRVYIAVSNIQIAVFPKLDNILNKKLDMGHYFKTVKRCC